MDVLKIILGAVATFLAFYATSSVLLAQKQLVAATRLNGYLTYWQNWIIEHNISKVYALGLIWNQEDQEAKNRGGDVKELMKLKQQRKTQLDSIKEQLEKGMDIGFDKDQVMRTLRHHSKESVQDSARLTRQSLVDGKTFISDEEATALGVAFTVKCIELKMGLIDLVDGVTNLLVVLMDGPDDFEIKEYSAEIADLIWKGISVSRGIDVVSRAARVISSKSVLSLTWKNIITGRRFSKR
jgi:hypothetical protein